MGLIDAGMSGPNWDKQTMHEHFQGKGKWLYEPASDDPELCPGGDWSRYECGTCGKFVKPFSNDEGDLICPTCEATGLVILDEEQLDRLEQVREFARLMGLESALERQLCFLARHWSGEKTDQCVLYYDFAPHSFSFCRYILPAYARSGERTFSYNGGLIFQGPSSPFLMGRSLRFRKSALNSPRAPVEFLPHLGSPTMRRPASGQPGLHAGESLSALLQPALHGLAQESVWPPPGMGDLPERSLDVLATDPALD